MSIEKNTPDFDEVADIYWRLGVMSSPSQLHGYLVGLLAVGSPVTDTQWLELAGNFIDPVEPPAEADQLTLLELLGDAKKQLEEGGMELRLLLPDDAVEISQRVDCLSQWCKGFLAGFAQGGNERQQHQGQQQYSTDVSEALTDMASISQASLGDGDEDEQQREQSLFDISEYLRLAAINIYLECEREQSAVESAAQTNADIPLAKNMDGKTESTLASPANLFAKAKPGDKLH